MNIHRFLAEKFYAGTGRYLLYLLPLLCLWGCKKSSTEPGGDVFQLLKVSADEVTLSTDKTATDIPVDAQFRIEFSASADTQTVLNGIKMFDSAQDTAVSLGFAFENDARRILVNTKRNLAWNNRYQLKLENTLQSAEGTEFPGISYSLETKNGEVKIVSATLNETDLLSAADIRGISYDDVNIKLTFTDTLGEQGYRNYFNVYPAFSANYTLSEDGKTVSLTNTQELDYYRHYSLSISDNLISVNGFDFDGYEVSFQTGLDSTQKFPQLTENELLDKVQRETFEYFWDFAHPVSGLARERKSSGDIVTTGGSGFGLQAIIVGVHRGFITRGEAVDRFRKIVDFLGSADRFHGAWPHWINGETGEVIPFSEYDDGGDLVETAYMAQGLTTVREFLDENDTTENALVADINDLLNTIEWDWYTRNNQDVLYWHWSPNYEWIMDMPVRGYNEALIVYVMAASSANHAIAPDVYHKGWASSGDIVNGNTFYGYTLPVGYDYGGPLFFSHYTFLGLDPRGLSDRYADYWQQNRNHTLINREYTVTNPNNYVGYSADSWGLTASDDPDGYGVHEPTRDDGTITPTAAISSIPYTPERSKRAIRHFYYILGDKLWGEYGFYDAFNPTEGWWANSYLAIDQGPIVIMIENYRTGLLWDLFMGAPEIQSALDKLDFTAN